MAVPFTTNAELKMQTFQLVWEAMNLGIDEYVTTSKPSEGVLTGLRAENSSTDLVAYAKKTLSASKLWAEEDKAYALKPEIVSLFHWRRRRTPSGGLVATISKVHPKLVYPSDDHPDDNSVVSTLADCSGNQKVILLSRVFGGSEDSWYDLAKSWHVEPDVKTKPSDPIASDKFAEMPTYRRPTSKGDLTYRPVGLLARLTGEEDLDDLELEADDVLNTDDRSECETCAEYDYLSSYSGSTTDGEYCYTESEGEVSDSRRSSLPSSISSQDEELDGSEPPVLSSIVWSAEPKASPQMSAADQLKCVLRLKQDAHERHRQGLEQAAVLASPEQPDFVVPESLSWRKAVSTDPETYWDGTYDGIKMVRKDNIQPEMAVIHL
ncbi:hypothetical protein MKZ38_005996 [Zalerion maritima]|uniref:Uncharacterized protein n=1 Tax=Zalerion maritima TaxID=339359 RepID=A0AAD5RJE5_9PEZI|nr:hypothetical protein MKZ38_005996 [Zalerion maritima]